MAVDDLLDVIHAAVEGRIGAGVVEVGGPTRMPLSTLHELVSAAAPIGNRRRRPGGGILSRHRAASAARQLLALESVPSRKLACPLGAATRDPAVELAG